MWTTRALRPFLLFYTVLTTEYNIPNVYSLAIQKTMQTQTLTESQKAWLAGFIDGEGYIGLTFQRKKVTQTQAASPLYKPYVVIANTNYEVLQWIQS